MTLTHAAVVGLVRDREVDRGRLVWCETPLGSAYHDHHHRDQAGNIAGPPVPDVLSITRSYPSAAAHEIAIFECKASRADFLADVRSGKYRRYLAYAHRLFFAAPRDVADVRDCPPEAGLLAWDARACCWRTRRAAPKLGAPAWRANDWFALLLAVVDRERQLRRVRDRMIVAENERLRPRRMTEYKTVLAVLQEIARHIEWEDDPRYCASAVRSMATRARRAVVDAEAWRRERALLLREAGRCEHCGWRHPGGPCWTGQRPGENGNALVASPVVPPATGGPKRGEAE